MLLAHHRALDAPGHHRDPADPPHLRGQDLRPHLHHDPRRSWGGDRLHQLFHLPHRLRVAEHRRSLGDVDHHARNHPRPHALSLSLHALSRLKVTMADIILDRVSKIYPNGVPGVRDISLDIKDGEFMIFLGPSGCGKSTTLRMIGGLESISKGDLLIGGRRMNDVDPADRDIAIVFQNYALYPHMTVAGNLAFGLKLR